MQLRDVSFVFSPSDLNDFLECQHLTALELAVAGAKLARPERDDPQGDLIRRKGEEHEAAYLAALETGGLTIARIEFDGDWEAAVASTEQTMRDGADIVYQAVLVDPSGWRGIADFLERQPDGFYEVADTKLARSAKPYFLLQLAFYSEQVGRIQGRLPDRMHVVLGTNERASYRVRDFDAYYRRVRRRFLEWIADPPATYPYPVTHCPICVWLERCTKQWEADDHLSLVAHMRRRWIDRLGAAGIRTLEELAAAPEELETELRPEIYARLRRQAQLQHGHQLTGEHIFDLLPLVEGRGLELLPRPSAGDVFFDIEGDPFYEPARGLEYLFGVVYLENGEPAFRSFWALDRTQERGTFERLVDFFHERLARYPDMHIYHYSHYEQSVLKRLMGELGTREDEIDELLRREVFVDLFRVVEQSLRISHPRYGLKQVETYFMPPREEDVRAGDDSILVFEEWLESGDDILLEAIERYNEFDCLATYKLREWLLERRADAGADRWKEPPAPREVKEEVAEAVAERERLKAALLAGAEEGDERWLAAQLLEYHRREARPVWWHYFRRIESTPDELVADTEAIGELRPTGAEPEPLARSLAYELEFPTQQHKLGPGDVVDPETKRGERIVEIDEGTGRLWIKRGRGRSGEPLPRALIPGGAWDTRALRAALMRLAEEIQDGGGRYRALKSMLRCDLPRARLDGSAAEAAASLDESYLFIQGPPGSGKTWTGAQLVLHLLRQGKRVGIAASSHKAIHNLLRELEEQGLATRGLKKCSAGDEETRYDGGSLIENESELEPFLDPQLKLLAGTAWLFSRAELDSTLDYLFVDEAGQVSLADALAMGTAADNVVLLGDPLQLAQVSQGVHPGGTGCSVLEHLLAEHATIPPERGLFLEHTRRMHPQVCAFVSEVVYDGRLESSEGMERQELEGLGAGIRYLPVEHEGRSQSALEEAERIAVEIEALRGRWYTAADGRRWRLRNEDVMVVAPYNAHVRCLRQRLPAGVRVGTVDKFQGQEAPVVFYATASSSGEEIPRGLEFLFSRNRLNVAISRARCLAYLVGSPRLLDVRCRSVEQMRLVNALCRFVELAEERSQA